MESAVTAERRAIQRLRWYMLLRWAGVAVLYLGGLLAHEVAGSRTSLAASNVLAPFVLGYNVVVWRLNSRWMRQPPADWRRAYRWLGNAQCSLDLLVLTIGIHYGGGIESWGLFEPVAVLVVAGLVLSERDSVFQGVFACALVDAVLVGEATGRLGHVSLGAAPQLVTSARYVAGFVVLYDIVVLFIVYLVVFIARRLREREEDLADLYDRERNTVTRLEELDRMKSDFVAAVSHELRTPLTAILGFSLHLGRNWERTEDSMRLEEVRAIQRQSERLQRLVEDLLDFSTIESGRLNVRPEALDLGEALSAAAASSSVPVTVDAPAGVFVMADRRRVEQILVNLLENAEKYGRPPVTVSAAVEAGEAVVTVADAGAGVPAGARGNLFTRFYQVDQSATRTGSGVGLGLALVKGCVEAQGGRVWYERGEPGARFRFSLPLAAAPARAVAERA